MAAILEKIFLALYPDMFKRLKTTIEPSFMLFTKIEQWFHPSAALYMSELCKVIKGRKKNGEMNNNQVKSAFIHFLWINFNNQYFS